MLVQTFTIITTATNPVVQRMHERMPVILNPANYSNWLHEHQDRDFLLRRLVPYPAWAMSRLRASSDVNNAQFERPECFEPV